jgi:hypothetical protein
MTNPALHPDTPPQHPPLKAPLSAPAVDAAASYTDKDLYTDFTDATDFFYRKKSVFSVRIRVPNNYA